MYDWAEICHFRYLISVLERVALVSRRNSFEIEASSMCRRYVFRVPVASLRFSRTQRALSCVFRLAQSSS
jgi:hypothetical protein